MTKKLVLVIGILIALSTAVLLGSQGIKSKNPKTDASSQKKVKELPFLVKQYNECPLSLRKYGKAFYDLAYQRWKENALDEAAKYFGTAVAIYDDIIKIQSRRPSAERKLRSYRLLSRSLTEARLKALFAKAQVFLKLNKRREALNELINIARFCGDSTEYPENESARKLLKKKFYLSENDMRDLGLESLK